MQINYLSIGLASFLISLVLVFLFKKISFSRKILMPKGTPLIGGIGIGMSFILVSLFGLILFCGLSRETIGIVLSSFIMLAFGAIDDWKELSISAKFFMQVIATAILIFFGVRTEIIGISNIANIIITFIWVIGITNAINHLDVMDGVAAGTAIIVGLAFFIISFLNGDRQTMVLSLGLIGASSGFLIYNFPPAKVYMGNSGSHFLGFVLAGISLNISYAPMERKAALLSPLLILGFPIFDTAFLILARLGKKKIPFKKSNDHLALRFLIIGHSRFKALFIMLGLCFFFSLCGIFVSQATNIIGMAIVATVILISLILTFKMGRIAVND